MMLPDSEVPIVAAFDVDKTLTNRDCVVPFLWLHRTWRTGPRLVRHLPSLTWAIMKRDRDGIKALITMVVFNGLSRDRIERRGEEFAHRVLGSWMRSDTMSRLTWHRESGHHVVLVSASYAMYVRHLGEALGCASVLACELEFDAQDRCTGRLVDGNCRGAEKERRFRQWLTSSDLAGASIYAYGDSAGDRQLLAMAHVPTRVGRSAVAESPGASR